MDLQCEYKNNTLTIVPESVDRGHSWCVRPGKKAKAEASFQPPIFSTLPHFPLPPFCESIALEPRHSRTPSWPTSSRVPTIGTIGIACNAQT